MEISEEIVTGFIAGDIQAFKIVYEKTKNMLYHTIFRMVGNTHDAEDIMHDVFIQIYEKRGLYRSEKALLSTWIYRIAINHALNCAKRKKRMEQTTFEDMEQEDFLDKTIKNDEAKRILKLMDNIKPHFKICIILKDIEEKSYDEISKMLKISIGTVKSRLNRGRKQLQVLLENLNKESHYGL